MSKSKSEKNRTRKAPIYKGDPLVFAVDHILKKQINGNKVEYFIKWSGYPDSENCWVEESNVTEDLIEEFNSKDSVFEDPQVNDSYFEENIQNLGFNLQLQSAVEDYQLFSTGTKSNGSNVVDNLEDKGKSLDTFE